MRNLELAYLFLHRRVTAADGIFLTKSNRTKNLTNFLSFGVAACVRKVAGAAAQGAKE